MSGTVCALPVLQQMHRFALLVISYWIYIERQLAASRHLCEGILEVYNQAEFLIDY